MTNTLILGALLLTIATGTATATPAITCHCFQDRSFDPRTPEQVTPYLLATTRNSFMAAVFDVSRKEIVRARMRGADASELWLAYYLAQQTGINPEELRAERTSHSSWRQLYRSHLPRHPLAAGRDDLEIAGRIVDLLAYERLQAAPSAIAALREAAADDRELILSLLLARWTADEPTGIYDRVKTGQSTWGEILHRTGRLPQGMESAVRRELAGE